MFELNMSFKKKFVMRPLSNMMILLYSDVFVVLKRSTILPTTVVLKRPTNPNPDWKPLNKINLDILVTDDLGFSQGFFHVKPDKASGPNFMCVLYKFITALTS